jgi:hypothetical protein
MSKTANDNGSRRVMSQGRDGVGSENLGFGGSIPSLPTTLFRYLPITDFSQL